MLFSQNIIHTEKAMLALGLDLVKVCRPGEVIYLSGELGSGKTTLVRGMLRGLGYQGFVKSPSYTLIEVYPLEKNLEVVHLDLYRFSKADEYWNIGLTDYLKEDCILLIEWPEKAEILLPLPTLRAYFNVNGNRRIVNIAKYL